MAVGDAHVFPGFHTPVLKKLSFQSHRLLFSHAEQSREAKIRLKERRFKWVSNSQTPGHEFYTLTTEPFGRARGWKKGK